MPIETLIAPRNGLRYDLPGDVLSGLEITDGRNIFFEDGLIKKRYGYGQIGSNLPLAGSVNHATQFDLYSGTNYLLVTTQKLAYVFTSPTSSPYWDTISESEVEDDCETTWTDDMGANGTVADEGTIKKVGTYSQKISPGAGFTTGLAAHRAQSLGDKSAYSFARFWIRSSVAQAAGDLQFLVDDTSACTSATETVNIPALDADTWKLVFLEFSDPASNLTSVEALGLSIATDNGACDIYIDDIQFVKKLTATYSTSDEDFGSSCAVRKVSETDNWWVYTNGVDAIKKWTGTGAWSNLVTAFPSGVTALLSKHVLEFKTYLVLADVTEDGNRYPHRIRWSDTADPEDFLNGNASSQDLTPVAGEGDPDHIKAMVGVSQDIFAVLKGKSIWSGYATGDTDVFDLSRRTTGIGCANGQTAKAVEETIVYLGHDDVFAFNGYENESVTSNKVRRELFQTMNQSTINKAFARTVSDQKEYWLFVPSVGSDYCDIAWVLNYDTGAWSRYEVADTLSAATAYKKQTTLTIDDLVGTIDQQTWRIGDQATLASAPSTILGDTAGNVYEYNRLLNNDDGTLVDGWFSTHDFNPTTLGTRFVIKRIDIYYTGQGCDVSISSDKAKTWTAAETLADSDDLQTPRSIFPKYDALMARIRIRNNTAGEHFEYSRMNIHWEPSGRRL